MELRKKGPVSKAYRAIEDLLAGGCDSGRGGLGQAAGQYSDPETVGCRPAKLAVRAQMAHQTEGCYVIAKLD